MRSLEQLELTARLLEEASNVGVWVEADDTSDNRRKRQLLREADWAASDALRSLPANAPATREQIAALVARIEPLADMVTEWMGTNLDLDYRIMTARDEAEALVARMRGAS